MILPRNCGNPPQNWGPGVQIIPIPIDHPGAFGTADLTLTGAIYLPFDYDLYGWWHGVGTLAGGAAPNVDFDLQLTKADPGSGGFVADLTAANITSASGDFVDRTANPVARVRTVAATSWTVARAVVQVGGVALTAFGGIMVGIVIKPRSFQGSNLALT